VLERENASRPKSIASAICHGPSAGEPIDFGTTMLPTKAMAYAPCQALPAMVAGIR
jgi:hypothetical protein